MSKFTIEEISKIEAVCAVLGNGWRVNKSNLTESAVYVVELSNRDCCDLGIHVRQEKQRWAFSAYVKPFGKHHNMASFERITVNPSREIISMARDLEKRLLTGFHDFAKQHRAEIQAQRDKYEQQQLVFAAMNRIVPMRVPTHNADSTRYLDKMRHLPIHGDLNRTSKTEYKLRLFRLNEAQMFKILTVLAEFESEKEGTTT